MLRLPGDEVLPYDELSPEPTAVASGWAPLFHLSQGTRFPALVLSLRALLRKVLPPLDDARAVGCGCRWARTSTGTRWRASSPTWATSPARWWRTSAPSPCAAASSTSSARCTSSPVRLEFFGDTIESIRAFDPETQRTVDSLKEVHLAARARGALHRADPRRAPRPPPARWRSASTCPPSSCASGSTRSARACPASAWRRCCPASSRAGLGTVFDYLPLWTKRAALLPRRSGGPGSRRRASCGRSWSSSYAGGRRAAGPHPPALGALPHARAGGRAASRAARVVEGGGLSLTSERAPPVLVLLRHAPRTCARPSSRTTARRARSRRWWSGSQRWREMRVAVRHRLRHAEPGGPAQAPAAGPQRDGARARRAARATPTRALRARASPRTSSPAR